MLPSPEQIALPAPPWPLHSMGHHSTQREIEAGPGLAALVLPNIPAPGISPSSDRPSDSVKRPSYALRYARHLFQPKHSVLPAPSSVTGNCLEKTSFVMEQATKPLITIVVLTRSSLRYAALLDTDPLQPFNSELVVGRMKGSGATTADR